MTSINFSNIAAAGGAIIALNGFYGALSKKENPSQTCCSPWTRIAIGTGIVALAVLMSNSENFAPFTKCSSFTSEEIQKVPLEEIQKVETCFNDIQKSSNPLEKLSPDNLITKLLDCCEISDSMTTRIVNCYGNNNGGNNLALANDLRQANTIDSISLIYYKMSLCLKGDIIEHYYHYGIEELYQGPLISIPNTSAKLSENTFQKICQIAQKLANL